LLKGLLLSNQQAYCCNNPVLHTDSNGRNFLEDLWNLFCDTVNASQEIEQYNIQASHSAWQQAGEKGADVLSSLGTLIVDTINATQEIERYNMNLELYATKRYMYAFDAFYDRVDEITTIKGLDEMRRKAYPPTKNVPSAPSETATAGGWKSKAIFWFWTCGTINNYLVERIKDAEWGELPEDNGGF
jgi:hypothetical protein